MFNLLKSNVSTQFNDMASSQLFKVDVDRDLIIKTYLDAFPDAVRQQHNCNCCKSFIRQFGGIITLTDNEITTIWDFDIEGMYKPVVEAMRKLILESPIDSIFVSHDKLLGTDHSIQRLERGSIRWNHLCAVLPKNKVTSRSTSLDELKGTARNARAVFKRALDEIKQDAVETVLDLIAQNSLYRGAESKILLTKFLKHKKAYIELSAKQQEYYAWNNFQTSPPIRNTAIGTLLVNISEGRDLDSAVTAFERMVAPTNYKRPTAIITQRMIQEAEKTIDELGFESALHRRHANYDDIDVNNFLFVNRDVSTKKDNIFDTLKKDIKVSPAILSKIESVPVDVFIKDILPTVDEIEVMFEKKHVPNLVSLIAPENEDAKNILKWNNGISWDYIGGLADSIKERVKSAGGNVSGELRISLGWFNTDDLDLHVIEPGGNEIYYIQKSSITSGRLDVDMNCSISNLRKDPVENIIYTNRNAMRDGTYTVFVHNYASRNNTDGGFNVEVESGGIFNSYSSSATLKNKASIKVVTFDFSKANGITNIVAADNIESESIAVRKWDIDTNKFHKVSSILFSPNYWEGEGAGNKHIFFILNEVKNPDTARGLFNEMLSNEIYEHKKVFEVLGQKLVVPYSDRQLSGLGFNFTQRNELVLKIHSKFSRIIKVEF